MHPYLNEQRTKDGMFYATGLLKQWNSHANMNKNIEDFFRNKETKEFIETLKNDTGITVSNENQVFTKVRGGKVQGTWMHPFLFIDFAMWLNPKFEVRVIQFVLHTQILAYAKIVKLKINFNFA